MDGAKLSGDLRQTQHPGHRQAVASAVSEDGLAVPADVHVDATVLPQCPAGAFRSRTETPLPTHHVEDGIEVLKPPIDIVGRSIPIILAQSGEVTMT